MALASPAARQHATGYQSGWWLLAALGFATALTMAFVTTPAPAEPDHPAQLRTDVPSAPSAGSAAP